MSPDETAAYYDDPANAQHVCDLLERTHPGWRIRREDRVWTAERGDTLLEADTAGSLNQALTEINEEGRA